MFKRTRAGQKDVRRGRKLFDHEIQHLFRSDDRGGELVAVNTGCRQFFLGGNIPGDRGFHESVSFTAGRYADLIIRQTRERDPLLFQQFPQIRPCHC